MNQLIQSYRTGDLGLFDAPPPLCESTGVLLNTTASLVSAGTEKMIVDIAKKSLVGKAKARPDLVKQVIDKMKQEGIKNTLEKVFTKLDTPIPLGYSCAGRVIEVGSGVSGVSVGDRIACGGAGYANHSEINFIPKNLFVKIPAGVDDLDASFVTVGSIALQGVRQTNPTLGERIAVFGLGLIGQLTVQILKANGCKVLGMDIDPDKLALAKELGADSVCMAGDIIAAASDFSNGYGVDGVIITASTPDNRPITDGGEISRLKGRIVVVGLVGMDIPRNLYYKKELEVKLSMAYGPGRYDPLYEQDGVDYPYPYVRWTEQRNFQAFLELVAEGRITPKKLVTHRFQFNDALKAYDLLEGKTKEKYLGIVLEYPDNGAAPRATSRVDLSQAKARASKSDTASVGLIGAGNFTKAVILPTLKKVEGYDLVGLCTATGISARTTGDKYSFRFATTNPDDLIESHDVNAVFVTTRHDTHASYVLKALQAGKYVFTEKPLCISDSELAEIAALHAKLATQNGASPLLMVGFNRRFSPLVKRMKEVLGDNPMSIVYRVNAGMIPKDTWIQDRQKGGGRIIGEVCHFIDTCSYLTGSVPVSASASCVRKDDQSIPDEDNLSLILTFGNGSTASIHYFAYGSKQMPKEYIEVFSGGIAMQMNDFRSLTIYRGSKKESAKNANQDKGFVEELTAFRDALKTGTRPVPFESIYATTQATFATLGSLRTGLPVKIEPYHP